MPKIEKVLLASQNQHKYQEFAQLLLSWNLQPAQAFTCEENAETYLGNAILKASAVEAERGSWILADDSGLEVMALANRPGLHSARYGLGEGRESISSAEQNALLLAELQNIADRRARFVCCLVLLSPEAGIYAVQSCVHGSIATEPRSKKGEEAFGYDPIFELPPSSEYAGQSFAELSAKQKQCVSHRFFACRKLQALL